MKLFEKNKISNELNEIAQKVKEEYSKNPIIVSEVFSKEELEKIDAYNSKNYHDLINQSVDCSNIFIENLKSTNLNESQEKVKNYLAKNDNITNDKVLFGTNILPEKKVDLKIDTKQIILELRTNLKKDLDNLIKSLESKDLSIFFQNEINSAITLEKIEDFFSKYKKIKEYKDLFFQIEETSKKIYSKIEKGNKEDVKNEFDAIKKLWNKVYIILNKDDKCLKAFNDLKKNLEEVVIFDDKKLLDFYKNHSKNISKENAKSMINFSIILACAFELTSIPTIIHEVSHFLMLSAYYIDPSVAINIYSPFQNANNAIGSMQVDLRKIPLSGDEWCNAVFSIALAPYVANLFLMGFFYILYRRNEKPISKIILLTFMTTFFLENFYNSFYNQLILNVTNDFLIASKTSDFSPNQIGLAVLVSTISVYAALKLYYDKKEKKESEKMLKLYKEVGGSKIVHDNLKNLDNLFKSINKDSKKIVDLISEINAELYSSKLSEYVMIGKTSKIIDNKLEIIKVNKFFTLDEIKLFEYDKQVKEVLKNLIKLANLLYKTNLKAIKEDEIKINNVLRLCQEFYLSDYWLNYENGAVILWNTINKNHLMYNNQTIVED